MASSASENRLVLSKIVTNGKHVYDQNHFLPTKNPEGVIQMGFAETQVCTVLRCFSSSHLVFSVIRSFPLIWWKSGLGDIPRPLFALLKELRSSEAWPISKTTMASQSSDRPLLRSCRKHEVVESYLILTEAKPPEQTSWSCSV
ncbi:hypothetical protein DVH24_031193 [Malus domestica]|uniref:Ig-like domain-containing protein n=1 Tax=Malus domestica TaxID=3750 RepID=A0A498HDK1_MALDO|nr:hypothetical protein DVH24_031193 [Malus domestica]